MLPSLSCMASGRGGPHLLRAALFALLTASLMSLLLTVSLIPRSHQFRVGEVSPMDVRAPHKLTFVSQVETRAARERAAESVPEQIALHYDLVLQQRRKLNTFLQNVSSLRADDRTSFDQRLQALRQLPDAPFTDETGRWVLGLDERRWLAVASESQRLFQDVMKERFGEARVEEMRRGLQIRAGDHLSDAERGLAIAIASAFIQANAVVDDEATNRLRREAQEAVAPVENTVEQGEILVREGEVVTPSQLEKLTMLGITDPAPDWRAFLAATLLSFVVVGCTAGYVYAFQPQLLRRERRLLMVGLLMLGTVVAAKIVLGSRPMWVYVFPLPGVAMLITCLLSARLAIVVTTFLALLVAYVAGGSLEVAAMLATASAVAAVAVWRKERLYAFFAAGLVAGVVQLAVVTAFYLSSRSDDVSQWAIPAVESLLNGGLSAVFAVGMAYITGRMFGITTTMQLLELASPTQPLLRRLLLEAPGTYHHSVMVGNLAERAAEVVGADPLLARVGGYYHDVGKLRRPHCFIENQAGGPNIHDSLDPRQSAEIIAAHVTDGETLAARYGLPLRVRELIPQHHGTRMVSFFYQKAMEQSAEPVDRSVFCYMGPKPQSKEGAIIMLADSVEAASRASRDRSPESITRLVEQLVIQRLEEGQLDECDLSLRDLTAIKAEFVALLNGVYHPRIEYPDKPASAAHAPA